MGARRRLRRAPGHWARSSLRLAGDLLQWSLGRRRLYRVRGDSMSPALANGDWVLVDIRDRRRLPRPGTLVVAEEPGDGRVVIKRVRSHGDRTIALGSDNPLEARDSRHFGSIGADQIVGPVTQIWRG